jgi:excisionase family DNA binding protein
MADDEPYLTVQQVADELGVTRQTIYDWIRKKKLPATQVLRTVRIKRSDLDNLLASHSTTASDGDAESFWDTDSAQDFQAPGRTSG